MSITTNHKIRFCIIVAFVALVCSFVFKGAAPLFFLVTFLALLVAGFLCSVGLHAGFDSGYNGGRGKQ